MDNPKPMLQIMFLILKGVYSNLSYPCYVLTSCEDIPVSGLQWISLFLILADISDSYSCMGLTVFAVIPKRAYRWSFVFH